MKYILEENDNETSRLIIPWKPIKGAKRRPSIRRHGIDGCGRWITRPGSVIGFDKRKTCALVLTVRRGDLISLNNLMNDRRGDWSHYRISPDLEPEACHVGNRELQPENIDASFSPASAASIPQLSDCDDEMRSFLAKPKRPRWLQNIINRQIDLWRHRNPAKYLHLAPSRASAVEIAGSVKVNPFAALRFFRKHLSPKLLDKAINESIEGGVIYAFERLTTTQILRAMRECPGTLLAHRADRLTDQQFEHCARFDPFAGIRIRTEVSAYRHAIALARSYTLAFPMEEGLELAAFQCEILESILFFPEPWLRAHKNEFRTLIARLKEWTQIKIDHDFVLTLLSHWSDPHQLLVDRYLAESI